MADPRDRDPSARGAGLPRRGLLTAPPTPRGVRCSSQLQALVAALLPIPNTPQVRALSYVLANVFRDAPPPPHPRTSTKTRRIQHTRAVSFCTVPLGTGARRREPPRVALPVALTRYSSSQKRGPIRAHGTRRSATSLGPSSPQCRPVPPPPPSSSIPRSASSERGCRC